MSDLVFRIPGIRLAEAAQRHNPRTFMYRFAWNSPPSNGSLGATHGLELPFMWDTLDRDREAVAGLGGRAAPQSLATAMHGAWASFIKTGVPSHPELPDWPIYDGTRRATMQLDTNSRVVDDPDGDERRLWDGVQF